MRLSTRGRYATRIMVYLAIQPGDVPARKQDIADGEGISADYAEQLLMKLKTAGLVRSHRGARGGFSLARKPEDVTVAEILEATEGPIAFGPCVSESCERSATCVTRPVWQEATNAVQRIFSATLLSALAEQAKTLRQAKSLSFQI